MFDDERPARDMPNNGGSADWTEDLQASTAFLTRLPVGADRTGTFDLRRGARAFPAAGAIIGVAAAAVLIVCGAAGMSALLSAVFAVTALIVITGALHEDGLADTADGFWGGADKERKLAIMRDSRVGTFGVISLLVSVFIRVAALSQIIEETGVALAAAALVAAETISRHGMVALMATSPPARSDGLAVSAGTPLAASNRTSLYITLAIGIPMLWFAGGVQGIVIAGVLAALALLGVRELAKRHIGGHTGDVCGAAQQLMEIAVLTGLALAAGD
jgi:adenosylcobinamide-GDP ribazoletransferase